MTPPENMVDWLFAALLAAGGGVMKKTWTRIDKISDKVDNIATNQAGKYIPRTEFDTRMDRLEATITGRFDRLEDKIDRKADK